MIMALYLRLSKEDGDMIDESNSITNQRFILRKFVEERPEFDSYEIKEYIDDGFSGKNFERPGIQELLEDVRSGKVFGIIVKDFSRFGRNHIEVGNYIEKIFPLLDVRFIAVNNSFDSKDYIGTTPDMDVAFENLMYDYFSEENSVKIRNDLMGRRMRGKYLATFAVFGYKKSPDNHNHIVPDEAAAAIVRTIFEKYAECGVKAEVARYLNQQGIPTPQVYAMKSGSTYQWKYQEEKKLWNGSIIGRILKNELYIGNNVFHKKETVEVGSRKTKCLPKDEWKVCEGTHEPIISKELFELVNSKHFGNTGIAKPIGQGNGEEIDKKVYCEGEKRKRGSVDSPIKGLVKCGGCRHNMQRRSRLNVSYYCRYYYEAKQVECCRENVRETELIEIVLSAIRHQARLAGETEKLRDLYNMQHQERVRENLGQEMMLQEQIQKLTDSNFSLYESYTRGEIDANEFMRKKEDNNKQIERYKTKLQVCHTKETPVPDESMSLLKLLEGKENFTELTKELVRQLIDAIYVYNNRRIEIVFKFQDKNACPDRKDIEAML